MERNTETTVYELGLRVEFFLPDLARPVRLHDIEVRLKQCPAKSLSSITTQLHKAHHLFILDMSSYI